MKKNLISGILLCVIVMFFGCKEDDLMEVVLDQNEVTLLPNAKIQLYAMGEETPLNDSTLTRDTLTSAVWQSDNPLVATVSNTGEVKALIEGTATISAKIADENSKIAKCVITVKKSEDNVDNYIPVMTSNTSPSGEAKSSTDLGSGWMAYNAFDADETTSRWISNDLGDFEPAWISYTFEDYTAVNTYTLRPESGTQNRQPVDFMLQGWDESTSEWVNLDTQTGITWDVSIHSFSFDNENAYLTYRFYATKSLGSDVISIVSLKMGHAVQ